MLTHLLQFVIIKMHWKMLMEEYPSPVEGIGLENRQVEKSAQGFESLFLRQFLLSRGGSSLVARRAHNPKVIGSNPIPATMVR